MYLIGHFWNGDFTVWLSGNPSPGGRNEGECRKVGCFGVGRSLESEVVRNILGGTHRRCYHRCQIFWYHSSLSQIQRSVTGVIAFKMLRLALRVRPSARLTRPTVLSGPAASAASPRCGPVSCHHLKRYHSNGPVRIRSLCHGRRVYNSILNNRPWVLGSQTACFSQSMRVYSLPPHQKVS